MNNNELIQAARRTIDWYEGNGSLDRPVGIHQVMKDLKSAYEEAKGREAHIQESEVTKGMIAQSLAEGDEL